MLLRILDFDLKNSENTKEHQVNQSPDFKREGRLIIHDNKQYVPAGDIAREFNYALSHASLLAREKKLTQFGLGSAGI